MTLKTLRMRITLISLNTLPARPIIWVSFNSSTLNNDDDDDEEEEVDAGDDDDDDDDDGTKKETK